VPSRTQLFEIIGLILVIAGLSFVGIMGYQLDQCHIQQQRSLVRFAVDDLWSCYLETETSVRGSVITANIFHIEFYFASLQNLYDAKAKLDGFKGVVSQEDRDRIDQIDKLIDFRMKEMASVIQALQQKGKPAAETVVLSFDGGVRETMQIKILKEALNNSMTPGLSSH